MSTSSAWTSVPHDPPSRRDWATRPHYAPTDFVTLLWRERYLMLVVFLVILALGVAFSVTLKKSYTAQSSLFVRLGQEYVYEPLAGDAGRGAVPDGDQVIQSEAEILGSGELRERVIRKVGFQKIFPALAAKYQTATPDEKRRLIAKGRDAIARNLKIETAPDNSIIRLAYQHEDPDVAEKLLNTLLEEYLVYRRSLLIDGDDRVVERQRALFEQKLAETDTSYQAFLSSNDIGDFAAQKSTLTQLQSQAEQQKYAVDAQLQDRLGRLAAVEAELARTPAETVLYRDTDTTASSRLAQMRLEREGLLSRYRPDAQPVRDIEAQIAQLEQGVASGRTVAEGARRSGPNPIWQTLQTSRNDLRAEVAALRESLSAYGQQVMDVNQRLLRLAELEPQFNQLTRDRDVLSTNVRDYTVKEQQDQAKRRMSSEGSDNIRIVQRAVAPSEGKSLKKPILALTLLFAAFTAACAGLVRMFLRPGLQTPASAARTLNLPVLATAGIKR
ncbi:MULTISPECIES: GumC family protein [unclassified Caulobacter]|uniref:GumC family protein n=1 Tax=unclassified Caulobacter TaxID=2648921 RepID=UPI000D390A32|nr:MULTISPECIES: GumC family protein [unclassified Caulobacter]PTS86180.1 lipopolysaccharide biosynthesis protein [Caulobacter sp. HMWF009]PTT11825.1 lipopolysaccharide biosynthesis protein [Caulobacter sp. HMWF025]